MPASAKPARFFVDTNIFVYSVDGSDPVRRAKSRELIELALTTGLGAVSYQVAQEFLNVVTAKFAIPLSGADARKYLDQVLVPLWRVSPSQALYAQALDIEAASGYGFYDSLIVAAALVAGCNLLYSEDLQHGRRFDGLQVVNPFLETP